MNEVLSVDNVFLKLQLKSGYLLTINGNDEFVVSHENGNGHIVFTSRLTLLEYMIQINEDFILIDKEGNSLEGFKSEIEE